MKVLLVARSFTRGGAATGAAGLSAALEAAGLDLVRASADDTPWRPLRLAERSLEHLLLDADEAHFLRLGPPSVDLAREVARHRPDIVQLGDISANTIAPAALAALPCPSVHRMSDFWPYHGLRHYADRPDETPGLARALFRVAGFAALAPTARVAPSDWLADSLAASGAPRPEVIRNAVLPVAGAAPRHLGGGPLRLGFISHKLASTRKGLDRLAEPIRHLGDRVHLTTFGRPPAPPGLDLPQVRHHGPFGKAETGRVMGGIDILLCPYRADNSPNTVTEAFAHGIPVIGQRGTGMDSYIADDRGALIDFDAPGTLARALDRIEAAYDAHSTAALAFARGPLAPATIGVAYRRLYKTLLQIR